jgi:predicted NUDIX family NTP pyrophosphohydrolase
MTGLKVKLAHKRADKASWSASARAQRKLLIKHLQKMIDDLEQEAKAEELAKKNGAKK